MLNGTVEYIGQGLAWDTHQCTRKEGRRFWLRSVQLEVQSKNESLWGFFNINSKGAEV